MPKVSVVVPIYNTEEWLPACLDALLAQTVKDIEIIAVDNGSTDQCARILENYSARDRRIRIIRKPHGDIYTARNLALREATGVWIAFCDSDDTLPPKAYEHMLRKAQRASCDVVVGGYIEIDERCEKLPTTFPRKSRNDFEVLMSSPCVWNKMIRRGFLTEHGLDFPPVQIEDVVFLAKLLSSNPRIVRIDRPVYYYWQRYSGNTISLSHHYTLDVFKGLLQSHYMVYKEMTGTAYQAAAEEYVYCILASSLKDFLLRIWDSDDRKVCYELFRNHVLSVTWKGKEKRFSQIFEVPFTEFQALPADQYLRLIQELNHRKAVLAEYRAGTIGFQYIYAYLKAWLRFKMEQICHGKTRDR